MSEILPPEAVSSQAVAQRLAEEARARLGSGHAQRPKLVWLELTGCSGNIISLLNGFHPTLEYALTEMVDLVYSNSLMAAEGDAAMDQLFGVLNEPFILAVEGAVALQDGGLYQVLGRRRGQPLTALAAAQLLGERAAHVIAVGACASDGGPSGAAPSPSGSVGLSAVLNRQVIRLPGCPCHPDWFLGTLAHLLLYGEPELDSLDRPLLFYGTTIHDRCPRRSFFDQEIFAHTLGESTCLFKLGCRGPVTRIDCPVRKWNGGVNWPIGASTCIGCAQLGFPDRMSPFVRFDTTREAP